MVDKSFGGYREKYLLALEEQERLEKQMGLQTDLLKKTMLQLGTAASGLDQSLDSSIIRLREVMRGGTGLQVVEQMEKVQAAVGGFERNREQENNKAAKVMSTLIEQYLDLQLPPDLKTSLKSYSKSLQKRLSHFRQYPVALEDLAKLQQLALEAATNEKVGLWQRIKGGKTLQLDAPDIADEDDVKGRPSERYSDVTDVKGTVSLEQDGEENYGKVAARIASTLSNLVEKIEPNDVIRHRMDIVRLRIERGMDWYVLAVTLEDIRDILFLRYLQADEEFSLYLKQVKTELKVIREALVGAGDNDAERVQAATHFSEQVSTGVDRIRESVKDTVKIDDLKDEVTEHISMISDALKAFRSQSDQASLTFQLKQLVEKVQSIEKESEKAKEALEEQRYKATHDTLTGLPNREAYGERAFQELQRFKRYCRPLSMCVCDLDKFKNINDTYGHQAGDKVLKLMAKVVSTRLRNVDFIARFGGEEFVILMPETTAEQAFSVLDKIRAAVAKTPFRFKENPVQITISFGIASFSAEDTVESVFERADKALYKAKSEGRNRCIIAQEK